MSVSRRLRLVAAAAALIGLATPAASQQELKFQGPIRIYAGFAAGGQSDILARLVADRLKDKLGRPVIVENKAGGGGRIAVETVKPLPPDGSALALANIAQMSTAPLVFTDLTYDAINDFTPISKAVDFQVALATGSQTKAQDYKAMIAWLKANPDKGTSGVPAIGGLPHLFGIQLGKAINLKLTAIPYRGGQPILAALVQGDLAMGWGGVADFIEQHRGGVVRIVAVTGTARSPQLQDVPTFSELGVKANEPNGWIGYFGPKGMAPDVVALLNREITAALKDPTIAARLEGLGFIITATSPEALAQQIANDHKTWKPVVDAAGLGGQKQ
ncbi:MAG: tripartite tricarboxylate transporter substrate-binding protein [Hyphomicrobiaceae bacterium]